MGKREDKLGRAAHIKRHTVGTSNEISFSVLDAAKNKLAADTDKDADAQPPRFGHISLFTLPGRRKKSVATPTKERGLPLSTGEFASAEDPLAAPSLGAVDVASAKKGFAAPVSGAPGGTPASGAGGARSLGFPTASVSPVRDPEAEIARRKTRRRRHRILVALLVVLFGLGLAGAGGWYLYQDHQRHMGQVAQLDEALQLIRQADETIVALDGIVAKPLDTASLAEASSLLSRLPEAREQLQQAHAAALNVSADMRESRDKEAANQTVAAATARLALIESGGQIVEQSQQAAEAMERLRSAWQDVIQGDVLAREAAALVSDTTEERVAASAEKTNAAIEAFSAARNALAEAVFAYPAADTQVQGEYIDKRLEAMGYALASDAAFLEKNKEEAVAQNDSYNRADAEAAALASQLSDDAAQPVLNAFDAAVAHLLETYSTARSQAGSADAFLRDYLGTPSK